MQRALDDRLLLSEAIDLVSKLVRAYPNGGASADKGYIGALASMLCEFPRQVAIRCTDLSHGVARETKFLPTVSDLVAWCERETEPLRADVARELRVVEQLKKRTEWESKARKPARPVQQITYGEFLKNCEQTGQKPRPIGAFEPGGYLGPNKGE